MGKAAGAPGESMQSTMNDCDMQGMDMSKMSAKEQKNDGGAQEPAEPAVVVTPGKHAANGSSAGNTARATAMNRQGFDGHPCGWDETLAVPIVVPHSRRDTRQNALR